MDGIETRGDRRRGHDPGDAAVVAALDRVRAVLAELGRSTFGIDI